MDTNQLFLIAQKARALQTDYLCGILVTDKTPKTAILCSCGASIKWWHPFEGQCAKKCGHEFTIRSQEVEDNHATDESGDPLTYIRQTVYARKKRPGHDTAIGELVGWWMDAKMGCSKMSRHVNIPIDSPYYDAFEYYGTDALFMVIGLDMSGDMLLVSPLDDEGHPETTDTGVAVYVTENTMFAAVQCFWLPIEYTEMRSFWPFMEE